MAETKIEWASHVWNPIRGCSRVSPGCGGGTAGDLKGGCYAEQIAGRFSGPGQVFEGYAKKTAAGYRWTGKLGLIPKKLAEPLSWRKPCRVFVNSMSDLFHEELTFEEIAAVVGVIAACPDSIFMSLTKRAKRMREWFEWIAQAADSDPRSLAAICANAAQSVAGLDVGARIDLPAWPLPNWQIGISAEDQKRWDERVPELLRCPAAVRFVSAEPLLGPIDIAKLTAPVERFVCQRCGLKTIDLTDTCPQCGSTIPSWESADWSPEIDQIIIGGESGHGARPCHVEWIRDLIAQCRATGVKPFVKQLGAYPVERPTSSVRRGAIPFNTVERGAGLCWRFSDKKGGNMDEWPEDLRVREQV